MEKRRLNPDGNSARETGARKKRRGGVGLSGNGSHVFMFGFAYIPFVAHRDEYRVTWGSAVLTLIRIRCFPYMDNTTTDDKGLRDVTSSSGRE